jgi:hypothetical protein
VEFAQVFSRQLLSDFENGVIGLRRFPGTSRLPCYSGGVRSLSELRFRLSRELSNFRILRAPPRLPSRRYDMAARLPVPASFAHRLRDSAFERDTLHLAAEILAHRLPLFGGIVDTGPSIDWRRDYIHQRTSGLEYFRRVPYLDFDSVGDHKLVWELNRHQHLVLLAQAACLTGRQEFLEEAFRQLRTWLAANPFLRGVNWRSRSCLPRALLALALPPRRGLHPRRSPPSVAGKPLPPRALPPAQPLGLFFAQYPPARRGGGPACRGDPVPRVSGRG